ncbi:MAG TPA: 2Fe-2S iron-sulfur cluster-binding protein [Kofleriaceae bacterium]|nr:2Fe-2S iron-sulfur cluster-binding protein [Kofleriaceae bacterium]
MSESTPAAPSNMVTLTIDGQTVAVPKGTNVLEAARTLGTDISAFCYHPGLSIAACCRQCLVSIEKNPKLQPSCQSAVAEGMVVHTKDPQSTLARKQMLEFTLVNHPIDCPICDKAGECTLQKLYFDHDNANSRVDTPKVHKDKAVDLGPTVVLDQERCILCTRCIRVCDEVAGVHQLEMSQRGDHETLGTAPGAKLDNPYSLNVVDVCPVGALTAKDFRFTMRAWELEATPSICQGCATGCNLEIHHKNERAWRLIPRHNDDVNQYWMCDDGRFTYRDLREERLAVATVGGLPSGWDRALARAGERLAAVLKQSSSLGVVLSATHSNEDNFALAMLAKAWGAGRIFLGARAAVPERADDKLRDADVNPNTAGVNAIAKALGLTLGSGADLEEAVNAGAVHAVVVLGDALGVSEQALARLAEIEVIAIASHERGVVKQAKVALPVAAWAELAGTVTNRKGLVQRMHAAFPPPGQAIPGWEAVVRLAGATGVKFSWTHAREVFKDMTGKVSELSGHTWVREARPLQLRFAGSRG